MARVQQTSSSSRPWSPKDSFLDQALRKGVDSPWLFPRDKVSSNPFPAINGNGQEWSAMTSHCLSFSLYFLLQVSLGMRLRLLKGWKRVLLAQCLTAFHQGRFLAGALSCCPCVSKLPALRFITVLQSGQRMFTPTGWRHKTLSLSFFERDWWRSKFCTSEKLGRGVTGNLVHLIKHEIHCHKWSRSNMSDAYMALSWYNDEKCTQCHHGSDEMLFWLRRRKKRHDKWRWVLRWKILRGCFCAFPVRIIRYWWHTFFSFHHVKSITRLSQCLTNIRAKRPWCL